MTTTPTALPTLLPRRRIHIHLLEITRLIAWQIEADQKAAGRKAGFVPVKELGFKVAGVAGGAEVSVLLRAAEVLADDDGGDKAEPARVAKLAPMVMVQSLLVSWAAWVISEVKVLHAWGVTL
jgi:hypothetical protein